MVTVATIDLESGELRRIEGIPHAAEVLVPAVSIAFAPDGRLVVGTGATQLSVIDPDSAGIVASIRVPEASTNAAMAATDDGRLVASGEDALVAVDLATGDLLWSREFATAQPAPCPWLAVAQSRSTVFCGDLWGGIEERSLDTGIATGRRLDTQLGAVGPLTVSPDGDELVAIGAGSSAISRWRLDGSGAITRMIARGQVAAGGYDPSGTSILVAERAPWADGLERSHPVLGVGSTHGRRASACSGPGRYVGWAGTDVLLGYIDEIARRRRISTHPPGRTSRATPFLRSRSVWFLDSGRRIYIADFGGAITPVDAGTRKNLEPEMRFDGFAVAISASTDGAMLAVTTEKDGVWTTRLVDAATGTAISPELTGPELTVMAGPGELIAADDDRLLRYSVPELEPIDALPGVHRAASRASRSATTAAPSWQGPATIPSPSTTSRPGSGSAIRSRANHRPSPPGTCGRTVASCS